MIMKGSLMNRMFKKFLGIFTCALSSFFIVIGGASSSEHRENGTLIWSFPSEPPTWNYWQSAPTGLVAPVLYNILEPLVEQLEDGTVAPLLAERWEVSADGREYIFYIREAKFHDGSALDAGDVTYSLLKNKESPVAITKGPLAPVETVSALDNRTVKITLSSPSQRFLSELGGMSGIIVPENFHENHDANRELIGTGPYLFGKHRPDIDLTLTRFEEYWGTRPYFEKIIHKFIPNETAAINAFLSNEVDMVASISGVGLDRLKAVVKQDESAKIYTPSPMYINYLFLNPNNKAFRDERVRKAVAHSINRDILLVAGQSGFGKTICEIVVPYREEWNRGYCPYEYNPAKAKELLADAGYQDLELRFPFITDGKSPLIKDVVTVQLSEVGIDLKSRGMDTATWLDQVWKNGDYDLANIDGVGKVQAYACRGGRPPLGGKNNDVCLPKFDQLVKQSDMILDRSEYVETMAEMTKIFADSAWVVPLYAMSRPFLYREGLVGIKDYQVYSEVDARRLRLETK